LTGPEIEGAVTNCEGADTFSAPSACAVQFSEIRTTVPSGWSRFLRQLAAALRKSRRAQPRRIACSGSRVVFADLRETEIQA